MAIANETCVAIQDLSAERRIISDKELTNVDEEDELKEYEVVSFFFVWILSFSDRETNRQKY